MRVAPDPAAGAPRAILPGMNASIEATRASWDVICPRARRDAVASSLRPLGVGLRFDDAQRGSPRAADGCVAWMEPSTAERVWARLRGATPVVVVTADLTLAVELVRRGARACFEPEAAAAWLPLAVRAAPMGLFVWSPAVARRVREVFEARGDAGPEAVRATEREVETLALFARGFSYDEAARALGVSANTVRSHVRAVYTKLEVATKTEAVLAARRRGWLTDEPPRGNIG